MRKVEIKSVYVERDGKEWSKRRIVTHNTNG